MSNIISCSNCQRKLQVPDALLGQQVKCPSCGTQFTGAIETSPAPVSDAPPPASSYTAAPTIPAPSPQPAYQPPIKRDDFTDDYGARDDYRDDYGDRSEFDDYRRSERRFRRRDLAPHRGVMILVFGILSIVLGVVGAFVCQVVISPIGIVLGIIAWVMGGKDLQEIRAGRMDPDGEGIVQGGWICGIIGTIVSTLVFVFCGLLMLLWFGLIIAGGMK